VKKEKVTVISEKRNCLECFHCKVSRKAITTSGLCFCDEKKRIKEKAVIYWQKKKVCRLFDDDSA
jgi:hypothetical protein